MDPPPNELPIWVRVSAPPRRGLHWLGRAGAAIVWPIERAFSAMIGGLLRLIDGAESFEVLAVRMGHAAIWPLRRLRRLLTAAATVLVPHSVRAVLIAPLHRVVFLGHWLIDLFVRAAEALNLDDLIRKLAQLSRPVWYPLAALGSFVHAWFATRSYRQFLWGIPVMLVILPLAVAGAWTAIWGEGRIASQYRVAVRQSVEEKDFRRVRLFERKLAQLGVDTQWTDFQTAKSLAEDGNISDAYERMQLLAPAAAADYPPAHFWIFEQLAAGKLEVPADEATRLMGIHLRHLQGLGFKGPEMQLLEALWLVQNQRPEEAASLLRPLTSRLALAAMLRMQVNYQLGRISEARRDARLVRSHHEERAGRSFGFSAEEYRTWALAEELLGDIAKAASLVRKRLELEPDNDEARRTLADLCLRQFEALLAEPRPDPKRLAELFAEAAELTDDPAPLQQRIGFMYRARTRIAVADRVLDAVSRRSQTPSPILEALGSAAAEAGDFDRAKETLRLAVAKDPHNAIAWNNYAWILAQGSDADLDEALAAVDKALAILPDEFRYRETRGQILVRLGKWEEAVADLEFAVNGLPDSSDIHSALAKAYIALGQKQLAHLHRQQAE